MKAKRKKSNGKKGAPPLEFNAGEIEALCGIGCTHAEIADFLGISKRTLEYRLEDEKTKYQVTTTRKGQPVTEKLTLRTIMDRGYARMRMSIRREQIKLLEAGNATMGIWLGKQYLGQTDRLRVEEAPPPPEAETIIPVTLEELLSRYRKLSTDS